MTISMRIEPETGVAIVALSGVLRFDDATREAKALWKAPEWTGRAVVWDFRLAQFDLSPDDVRNVASFILKSQPTPPPEKVAFVTAREVDYGMARMFGALREDSATDFRVFRDYDEAVAWARPG